MDASFARRRALLGGVAGVVVLAVAVIWARWDPAAVVAYRTAAALESRDARTLIRLADTDEIVTLGLSEAKVKAWLDGTIWREGSPGTLRVTPDHIESANIRRFTLTQDPPRDPSKRWLNIMQVYVTQQGPDRPWHLSLSWVLKASQIVRPNPALAQWGDDYYRHQADTLGIRGIYVPYMRQRYLYADGKWSAIP